ANEAARRAAQIAAKSVQTTRPKRVQRKEITPEARQQKQMSILTGFKQLAESGTNNLELFAVSAPTAKVVSNAFGSDHPLHASLTKLSEACGKDPFQQDLIIKAYEKFVRTF